MNTNFDVIFSHPGGRGWGSIEVLAELASRELNGRLIKFDASGGDSILKLARGFRPRLRGGKRKLLVIAPSPAHLSAVLELGPWLSRYCYVAGWVIDSFWTDRIPRVARTGHYFDHVYVTDPDDVAIWQSRIQGMVSCLPMGTDALEANRVSTSKTVDVQRVGRQPAEWEDDDAVGTDATKRGLIFVGRPAFGSDDTQSQVLQSEAMAAARYVLAFSNRVNPTNYTHPTREYVTARWVDSLAAGAVVAGIAPNSAAAKLLLWPGACLELGTTDRVAGLEIIAKARDSWSPRDAAFNRQEALRRLDWRHRLKTIANDLTLDSRTLDISLAQIESQLNSMA